MVTIQDVAKEAGVSKATVSYVLSGSNAISEQTTKRVQTAMKKLGYSVNHTARALATAKTNTIAIVAPYRSGNFFSLSRGAYLYALSNAARKFGYDALLLTGENDRQLIVDAVEGRKIDGAILLDIVNDDPRIATAKQLKLPVVLLGKADNTQGLPYVDTDFEYAAEMMIHRLAAFGHKEVVLIGWPQEQYDIQMNYAVRFLQKALECAQSVGIVLRVVYANDETLGAPTEITEALCGYPQATAFIIHNDAAVLAAPQVMQGCGLAVPDDISIMTVVPDQIATGMKIPYTSFFIDVNAIVDTAMDVLVRQIQQHNTGTETILVKPNFADLGSLSHKN